MKSKKQYDYSKVISTAVVIYLTPEEMATDRPYGERRHELGYQSPLRNEVKNENFGLEDDVQGVFAEHALAKYCDCDVLGWLPTTRSDVEADVDGRYQSRSTKHPEGRLALRPHDRDDQQFVLVVYDIYVPGKYYLCGWLWAWEIRSLRFAGFPRIDDPPCHWATQGELHLMGTLVEARMNQEELELTS